MTIALIPLDTTPDHYRFSGYQLPYIRLDDKYVVGTVHPYYINQPTYWQKPAYQGGHVVGGNVQIDASGNTGAPVIPPNTSSNETGLFTMLNI